MNYCLYLDTSTAALSLCLTKDGSIIAHSFSAHPRSHNEELTSCTTELVNSAGLESLSDVSRIVFGVGPGSFTGLRIGLSFVKGIFSALPGLSVYAVPSFYGYLSDLSKRTRICPLSSAGRGDVFAALYHIEDGKVSNLKEPQIVSMDELSTFAGEDVTYVTSEIDLVSDGEKTEYVDANFLAVNLARLEASGCKIPGELARTIEELSGLSPCYLRGVAARTIAERRALQA